MKMNCKECGYWYADESMNDGQPCCWWIPRAPGEVAPCDEKEEYIPNDYYGDECNGICNLCPEGGICALSNILLPLLRPKFNPKF